MNNTIQFLSDEGLLSHLMAAVSRERHTMAHLIALLAEMDTRKLYLAEGYASLFTYCTRCLRLSEHAAYGRIEAARAARRFPIVLELLTDGSITLTTVCLLAPHLTERNHRELLEAARQKTKREVEQQVAALAPKPDVPSAIRKLPQPTAPVVQAVAASVALNLADSGCDEVDRMPPPALTHVGQPPPVVKPLAPGRYKVQLTIGHDTHDKLRRVQDLLRHVVPSGDPAIIFDRALTVLLGELERTKLSKVERPRSTRATNPSRRHVPANVKREVWARDDGQCAFVGTDGRCQEAGFLELHHVVPFADGGPTTVDNLQLRCRAHNAYEARSISARCYFVNARLSNSVRTEPDNTGSAPQSPSCHVSMVCTRLCSPPGLFLPS